MMGIAALQSVQYISAKGKRLAVVNLDDWETLLEWLETVEDIEIAKQAMTSLKSAGGDRQQAGWLRWDEVKEELG
ncbi:MAG: hypothetical protein HND44_19985 [Chloroflexi bacterium]|nr:hypothetical protein [Ardenticatenaceae bacterium]MBL1130731.1 hypothetical protein [Chloroflexota bacterium]NOG36825.1 hypothetical protein [Chloroflexota bacterium]